MVRDEEKHEWEGGEAKNPINTLNNLMAFYLIWFEFVAYIELCGFSIEIEIENCGENKQEF